MGMMNGPSNSRRSKHHLTSEINVTPLVDVMLVLLIVFMVTTPMMVSGVQVDLPETKAGQIQGNDEPLVISINKDNEIYILNTKIANRELATKLKAITNAKMDSRIFVRGDKNVSYGDVMNVVSEINAAGFTKVALITNSKSE